jgi:hypothetical protein
MTENNIEVSEPKPVGLYFGNREVKAYGVATGADLCWVTFKDGTREVMNVQEFEAAKSSEPTPEGFDFDKKRLLPASVEILKTLQKWNVRLEDIGFLFRLAIDALQLTVNQSKEVAYGQPAWAVRVDDIQKVLDDGLSEGIKPIHTDVLRDIQGTVIKY